MPRSIFGWNYPPGCNGPPEDEDWRGQCPECGEDLVEPETCPRCSSPENDPEISPENFDNEEDHEEDHEEHSEIIDAMLGKDDEDDDRLAS